MKEKQNKNGKHLYRMGTVTSKDGTSIGFDQSGHGPAIILVVGTFNDRATGAPLAQFLERQFTVFNYDRRGRGESGDRPSAEETADIGDVFSISIAPDSEEEALRVFNELSAGGQVSMPLEKTFWNALFGELTDKFGIKWRVNYEYEQ